MDTILNTFMSAGQETAWLMVLVDAGVKGLGLLLLTCLAVLAARRTSAASRHLVWTLTLTALIFLPVLSYVLPSWQLPLLPVPSSVNASDFPRQPVLLNDAVPELNPPALLTVKYDNPPSHQSARPPIPPGLANHFIGLLGSC
jgi:hypothetical protein